MIFWTKFPEIFSCFPLDYFRLTSFELLFYYLFVPWGSSLHTTGVWQVNTVAAMSVWLVLKNKTHVQTELFSVRTWVFFLNVKRGAIYGRFYKDQTAGFRRIGRFWTKRPVRGTSCRQRRSFRRQPVIPPAAGIFAKENMEQPDRWF